MRFLTGLVVGDSGGRTGTIRDGFSLLLHVCGVAARYVVTGFVRSDLRVGVVCVGMHRIWRRHLLDISRGRVDRLLGDFPRDYGSEGHRYARRCGSH